MIDEAKTFQLLLRQHMTKKLNDAEKKLGAAKIRLSIVRNDGSDGIGRRPWLRLPFSFCVSEEWLSFTLMLR